MLVRFFQSRNIYYGWVVLVVSFITMFLVLGFRFAFGVYYVAILEDTGWQRAETAGIFSTAMVVYGIFSIISGAIFDWVGPRILFPAGCMLLGLALLLCSTITTLWQFYLYYGVLVGISYSMVGFITHMAYVPRWFVKNRGLTTSLALSGIGAGALCISILSEALLETLGWRSTFALAGLTIIVFLVPLTALFHRDSPQAIGLHPDGRAEAPAAGPAQDGEGITLAASVRTPAFWLLFAAVTSIGMGNMTMVVHQTRLLVDKGFALSLAAVLLGITGFLRSFGGMIWGALSDRIGRGPCIWAASALGVAGLVLLKSMDDSPDLLLVSGFILLWGMGYLAISPLYAATAADLFQGKHFGKILGMLDQGFGLGAASGPYLAGLIFDRYGSYDLMLSMLMGGAIFTGITLAAAVARTPRRP